MKPSTFKLNELTQQGGLLFYRNLHRNVLILVLIHLLGACGGATDTTENLLTDASPTNQLIDAPPSNNKSATDSTTESITRIAAPIASSPKPNPFAPTASTPISNTNSNNTNSSMSNAPISPLSSKSISSTTTMEATTPPISIDNNIGLDLFHEGPIPAQFNLSRSIVANTSSLRPLNTTNPLYTGYFTDGVNIFRAISQDGNNDLYPVLSRFYNGFDEYQLVPELFGIYQDWSSMTLLSPATPTIASYVTLKQQIFRYESDFLDNRLDLDTRRMHKGTKSLRLQAVKPVSPLSLTKTSIDNENLLLRKNTAVSITAWFYIAEGTPTGLLDLECGVISESPGIRLLLSDQLEPKVEMKWGNKTTYRVPPTIGTKIPRNTWVKIRLNLAITDNTNGIVQLYVNDRLVIDARGQTLYNADIIYNRLQMGITANASPSNAVVYMDEINFNSIQISQ